MQTTPSPLEAAPSLTLAGSEIVPVRVAQPADEAPLMAMLRVMHKEGGFRDGQGRPFPICEDMVRATVQRAIIPNRNDPSSGQACCGIIGEPGRVEASICLGVSTTWYSPKPFLGDFWTFVYPEYRHGTNHAKALIEFAKAVAVAVSMPLTLGNVAADRAEAKDRFLSRSLGVKRYGSTFLFNPDERAGAF